MQIFRSESNIKKAAYLSRRESFLSSKDTYLSNRDIYLSGGKNIVEKRRLIFSCVRGLMPRTHEANKSILFAQILDPYEVNFQNWS